MEYVSIFVSPVDLEDVGDGSYDRDPGLAMFPPHHLHDIPYSIWKKMMLNERRSR